MASHLTFGHAFLLISVIGLWVTRHAAAEVYTVGDEDGWIIGRNYLLWTQQYNFSVGDVLLFKYVRGQHNVKEVTEATFRSCDSSSGVIRTYTSGNDRVNLTEPGKHWVVCDIKGHCQGGMKFGITVASSSGGAGGPTSSAGDDAPPLPLPPVVAPGNAAAAGRATGWGRSWLLVYWFVVHALLHLF